jgi:6-phosphogluconolactonase
MRTEPEVQIWADRQALAQAAAELFILLGRQAVAQSKLFRVMLSGGSTPRALHEVLSQPDYAGRIDWSHVQFFWGDERCVPPDHPDSNYRMAAETLLKHVPIPAANIHRIRGELSPQHAAADYQRSLSEHFMIFPDETGRPLPQFDLILLGLGTDGHTASLFPGSDALAEDREWVTSIPHDRSPEPLVPRVTITLPVIQAANQILFLVAGADKANRLAQVLAPPHNKPLPAQLVRPTHGKLLWMVDRAAAAHLEP